MYGSLNISTSGMIAQRTRLNVIAANIANARTVQNEAGEPEPYRRRIALLSAEDGPSRVRGARVGRGDAVGGVQVTRIAEDSAPFRKVYDPSHPLAAKETDPARDRVKGYVNYPNVDTTMEQINALEASRAYEANVAAAEAAKSMMAQALRLIA
jgi:flagellar basal-body rod protein FlgC